MGKHKENALKPTGVPGPVYFLSEDLFKKLQTEDLKRSKYPIYLDFSAEIFQLRNLKGIEHVKANAVKEITLNNNKLSTINDLVIFTALKRLRVSRNLLQTVTVDFPCLLLLDVSFNKLTLVPDLSKVPLLQEINLSGNALTGDGWNNFLKCPDLETIKLSNNKISWPLAVFAERLQALKPLAKLTTLALENNPVSSLADYRSWVATALPQVVTLDGKPITKEERKKKLQAVPPAEAAAAAATGGASASASGSGTRPAGSNEAMAGQVGTSTTGLLIAGVAAGLVGGSAVSGVAPVKGKGGAAAAAPSKPMKTVSYKDLMTLLTKAFEDPAKAAVPAEKLVAEMRGIAEAEEQGVDIVLDAGTGKSADALAELMTNIKGLVERVPRGGRGGVRALISALPVRADELGKAAEKNLVALATAGGLHQGLFWDAVNSDIIAHIKSLEGERERQLIAVLAKLVAASCPSLSEPLRPPPLASLAALLGGSDMARDWKSEAVTGLLAVASHTAEGVEAMIGVRVHERACEYLLGDNTELQLPAHSLYNLCRVVRGIASVDADTAAHFATQHLHVRLIAEVRRIFELLVQGVTAKVTDQQCRLAAAQLMALMAIATAKGNVVVMSPVRLAVLEDSFTSKLLKVASMPSVEPQLLYAALEAVVGVLRVSHLHITFLPDTKQHKHAVTDAPELTRQASTAATKAALPAIPTAVEIQTRVISGLGGLTPLLGLLGGEGYSLLCKRAGLKGSAADGSVQIRELTDRGVCDAIAAVLDLLNYFGDRASSGDEASIKVCDAMNAAQRETLLFSLLVAPDALLKVKAVEALAHVPVSNFDDAEVTTIVGILPQGDPSGGEASRDSMKAILVGRERLLAATFDVLRRLMIDTNKEGVSYREKHLSSVKVALAVLEANASRVCVEAVELELKDALSIACVAFIRDTIGWAAAVQYMTSVECQDVLRRILLLEDTNTSARPTFIEKTPLASCVKSLVPCLSGIRAFGNVAWRVLERLAELVEGTRGRAPTENEDTQTAKPWVRQDLSHEKAEHAAARQAEVKELMGSDGAALVLLLEYVARDAPVPASGYVPRAILQKANQQFSEGRGAESSAAAHNRAKMSMTVISHERSVVVREDDQDGNGPSTPKDATPEQMVDIPADDEDDGTPEVSSQTLKLKAIVPLTQLPPLPPCIHGPALAALIRLLLAVLWYGTPKDKAVVRTVCGTVERLRMLCYYTQEAQWLPNNVGAKMCWLLQELLVMDPTAVNEQPAAIERYDIAARLLQGAVGYTDDQLRVRALTPREELLVISAADLFCIVCRQLQYIDLTPPPELIEARKKSVESQATNALHSGATSLNNSLNSSQASTPQPSPASTRKGTTTATTTPQSPSTPDEPAKKKAGHGNPPADTPRDIVMRLVFSRLLPSETLVKLVRYLYYDTTTASWPAAVPESAHQAAPRDRARRQVGMVLAEYIGANRPRLYEILENINALEIREGLALRPSFLQELLVLVQSRTYCRALGRYMVAEKMVETAERVVTHGWFSVDGSVRAGGTRLVVLTNARWYVMKDARGSACPSCPPDNFCPNGPSIKETHTYAEVTKLRLLFGGHAVEVTYTGEKAKAKTMLLVSSSSDEIDALSHSLQQLATNVVVEDVNTSAMVQGTLSNPSQEIVLLVTPLHKVNIRGASQERLVVLTDAAIYNYKFDESKLGFEPADAHKVLSLRSSYQLSQITHIRLADTAYPDKLDEGASAVLSIYFGSKEASYTLVFGSDLARELWRRTLLQYLTNLKKTSTIASMSDDTRSATKSATPGLQPQLSASQLLQQPQSNTAASLQQAQLRSAEEMTGVSWDGPLVFVPLKHGAAPVHDDE